MTSVIVKYDRQGCRDIHVRCHDRYFLNDAMDDMMASS